ncbi:hypothetical protein GCM10018793_64600 [Streptomyces sulfonofaciens]|uniref:Nudix hydrolase domain-containing protein n=1 Tax=Streptomyces sulfonofaciens TaxID=68272 RepID=A0A919GNE0_9ACTN|nr:NUDIX domain-containing protein [Streptomyces sulfonofaciens]GHH87696.1 hypothetical protein GCM10018793_64600 [Streptomyces sulfonofaciens]
MPFPDAGAAAGPQAPVVRLESVETLADDWLTLRKFRLETTGPDGTEQRLTRLSIHRGDRVGVLLHSPRHETVVLTSQFRLPVLLHGRGDGQLLEVPGGLLDDGDALEAARRETEEETGFRVGPLTRVSVVYMAPQLSHERTHLFVAEYDPLVRVGPGGGVAEEGEDIRVLQLPLDEAVRQVSAQEAADGKTLLLLLHLRCQGLGAPQGAVEEEGRP